LKELFKPLRVIDPMKTTDARSISAPPTPPASQNPNSFAALAHDSFGAEFPISADAAQG